MNRIVLFFVVILAGLWACKKNQPPSCRIVSPAENAVFELGDSISVSVESSDPDGSVIEVRILVNDIGLTTLDFPYNVVLLTDNLTPGNIAIKAVAVDNEGLQTANEIVIKLDPIEGIVSTLPADQVTHESATVGGNVTADGGAAITESGVYWGIESNPESTGTKFSISSGLGEFTGQLTELDLGTTYYYKAYAVNDAGESLGNEMFFRTDSLPIVASESAQEITHNSAWISGNIINDGGTDILEVGFFWGTTSGIDTNDSKLIKAGVSENFSVPLLGLEKATTYYFRAYARNAAGTGLGEEMMFSTLHLFDKSDLIVDYPFNGNANDASGNNLDGSVFGPVLSNDRHDDEDGAYLFDGQDDYIRLPDNAALNTDNSFSIETWIHKDCYTADSKYVDGAVFGQTDGSSGSDIPALYLSVYNNRTIRAAMRGTANPVHMLQPASTIMDETWHHIVMVRNAADNSIELFLDGISIGKNSETLSGNTASNDWVGIGGYYDDLDGLYHFFCGKIDLVRIWNKALTASDVGILHSDKYVIE
jgi:hypothetical protein